MSVIIKEIGVKDSIAAGVGGVSLVNDVASPGNNKVYGTNGSGVKEWKSDPGGGGAETVYANSGSTFNWSNGLIQTQTLSADLAPSFTNPVTGKRHVLIIDASGASRTLTFLSGHVTPGQTAVVTIPSGFTLVAEAVYANSKYYWTFNSFSKAI